MAIILLLHHLSQAIHLVKELNIMKNNKLEQKMSYGLLKNMIQPIVNTGEEQEQKSAPE